MPLISLARPMCTTTLALLSSSPYFACTPYNDLHDWPAQYMYAIIAYLNYHCIFHHQESRERWWNRLVTPDKKYHTTSSCGLHRVLRFLVVSISLTTGRRRGWCTEKEGISFQRKTLDNCRPGKIPWTAVRLQA